MTVVFRKMIEGREGKRKERDRRVRAQAGIRGGGREDLWREIRRKKEEEKRTKQFSGQSTQYRE